MIPVAVIRDATGFRSNTGIIDSDAFRDYLKKPGRVSNPTEKRVIIMPVKQAASPGYTGIFPCFL